MRKGPSIPFVGNFGGSGVEPQIRSWEASLMKMGRKFISAAIFATLPT